jgi:hypothetical protein
LLLGHARAVTLRSKSRRTHGLEIILILEENCGELRQNIATIEAAELSNGHEPKSKPGLNLLNFTLKLEAAVISKAI